MLMRESDIRLTSYPPGPMYRPGQPAPNETYNPNMYSMPPNYRMATQYPGPPDSLPSGPQSIDSAAMLPPAVNHGPPSMPPFYPNRYSFSPVEAQLGPQSYPGNGPEQQQQQQYAQPSTAMPHPQQFPPHAINAPAPQSMNYVNNGEVAGAGAGVPYGHMPTFYGQQPHQDTTVMFYFRFLFFINYCVKNNFSHFSRVFCVEYLEKITGVDVKRRDDYTGAT